MPVHETPRTIEELKAWYVSHHLPPEDVTRFFIGKDVREPRAFGIYRDGDCFVVYKNKDDGSRAVRYHGPDEGYAVNELYLRLKQEIANQKGRNGEKRPVDKKKERRNMIIALSIFVAAVLVLLFLDSFNPDDGYYNYHNRWYYYGSSNWYVYEDDWVPYNADAEQVQSARFISLFCRMASRSHQRGGLVPSPREGFCPSGRILPAKTYSGQLR